MPKTYKLAFGIMISLSPQITSGFKKVIGIYLLLSEDELAAINSMRRGFNGLKPDEAVDKVIDLFSKTKNNNEFVAMMSKAKWY